MDTILIVGGRPPTIRKAVECGLRVVFLQHPDLVKPEHISAADATLLVDYMDWSVVRPLVTAAHAVYQFTAVVTLAEQVLDIAARITDHLGLPGTPHRVANLFKDKLLMRETLRTAGVATVPAAPMLNVAGLLSFGAEHGYPFVVKPVDGTGSRGVTLVRDEADVSRAWAEVAALRARTDLPLGKFYPVDRFMMEGFIEGAEFSVESFSFHGRHIVIGITEKLTSGFVEVGHAQPARISSADEESIVEHVGSFLTAMGLRDGNAHTELRLGPDGPRVIESHNRVGGDRIMDLVEHTYRFDLERYAVAWPFGLAPELDARPRPVGACATRFLHADPGEVVQVHGVAEVTDHPDVIGVDVTVSPGDRVHPLAENFDRVGQVVVVGPDADTAIQCAEELAAKVSVVTR